MSAGNRKRGKKKPHEFRFLIAPSMSYPLRILLVVALIAGGFVIQLFNHLVLGPILIFAGALLGAVRSVAYEPSQKRGKTEWNEVLPAQWDQAFELIRKGKRDEVRQTTAMCNAHLLLRLHCTLSNHGASERLEDDSMLAEANKALAKAGRTRRVDERTRSRINSARASRFFVSRSSVTPRRCYKIPHSSPWRPVASVLVSLVLE